MLLVKRKSIKTPTEKMVNVDTQYLRAVCHERDFNMSEVSIAMGYCADYISNSITDGRMNRELLHMLSTMLDFPYKSALATTHRKRRDDLFDLLEN